MNKRKQSGRWQQLIFSLIYFVQNLELKVLQNHHLIKKRHQPIQLFKLIRSEVYEIQPSSHKRSKYEFKMI